MFEGQPWFEYLDEPMRELVELGERLLEREKKDDQGLTDYSFVVFPVAKAYEGFLKKFLYDLELIDQEELLGRQFRIGRSLNPALPEEYRNDQWVYQRLVNWSKSRRTDGRLPGMIWDAWREGRNEVAHYFIGGEKGLTLVEAERRLVKITETIKEAVRLKNEK